MTQEEKKMRDFLCAEIKNRDFGQDDLDRLSAVLYPHDGTEESVRSAARKFGSDMFKWAKKQHDEKERKTPKPLTDAEIEELAALL